MQTIREVGANVNIAWTVAVNVNVWVVHLFLRRLCRRLAATFCDGRVAGLLHGLTKTRNFFIKYLHMCSFTPHIRYTHINLNPLWFIIKQNYVKIYFTKPASSTNKTCHVSCMLPDSLCRGHKCVRLLSDHGTNLFWFPPPPTADRTFTSTLRPCFLICTNLSNVCCVLVGEAAQCNMSYKNVACFSQYILPS